MKKIFLLTAIFLLIFSSTNAEEINNSTNAEEINNSANAEEINNSANAEEINNSANAEEINNSANAEEINNSANATKIDKYREMLESGTYTIRYDNLTPAPRITNRNVAELYGKNGLASENNHFFLNRPLSGIITSRGENRYEEVGFEDFFQCRLMRGGENFIFTRYKDKDGGVKFFGSKKGKVEANSRNYLSEILYGESFGDVNFTEMMNAITSEKENYQFAKTGELESGITFEDFFSENENKISAIRFYFDGEKLVKISFASYNRDKAGKVIGNKCIIKILEFSNVADEKLLQLPTGLEDITKR